MNLYITDSSSDEDDSDDVFLRSAANDFSMASVKEVEETISELRRFCTPAEEKVIAELETDKLRSLIGRIGEALKANSFLDAKTSAMQTKLFGQLFKFMSTKPYHQEITSIFTNLDHLSSVHLQIGHRIIMHTHKAS